MFTFGGPEESRNDGKRKFRGEAEEEGGEEEDSADWPRIISRHLFSFTFQVY